MAVVSTFYDTIPGKGVNELEWAVSAPSRGALYGVDGQDDLRLTAHPATANMVVLSTGQLWGQGVWDIVPEPVNVQCVAPPAGVTRWDLICARRDWQATGGGPTTFVAVQGTSSPAIPPSRNAVPGEIDDQPLWFVRWTGGQSQPTQIVDMRCWASSGGVEAAAGHALQYLGKPGAAVRIGANLWRYSLQANGVWGWLAQAIEHQAPAGPSVYGNGFVPYEAQGWGAVTAQLVEGVVYINGAALGNLDWAAGTAVCNFPPPYRPRRNVQGVNCQISAGGDVVMTSGGKAKQAVSVSASFPIDLGEV